MEGKDHIRDLFQDKLSQLEVPVRPEIWSAVSSQIGAAAPAAAGGLSILSKLIIGVSVAASVSVGVYLVTKDKGTPKEKNQTAQEPFTEKESDKSSTKTEDKKDQAFTFNKIIELPSDLSLELNDKITTEEELENKDLIDNTFDGNIVVDKLTDPEIVPKKESTKKDPLIDQKTDQIVDSKNDEVVDNVMIEESDYEIEMFDIFTPNFDGIHDELLINTKGLSDFNLVVLDMNYKVVYQTNDPDFRWNGVGLNNEMVPSGKYIYYITAKDSKGKIVSKYSPLEIVR